MLKKMNSLEKENGDLKRLQQKSDSELLTLKQMQNATQANLESAISRNDVMKNELRRHLTKAQLDRIFDKKNSRWEKQDIENSIALLALGNKSYQFIREEMKIPLPSVRTVKRHLAKIDLSPGILTTSIKLMEYQAKSMSKLEKCAAFCFDEVMVYQKYVKDTSRDIVIEPKRNMQVIFLRGIYKNWKEPIFFDFDRSMTVPLVEDLLRILHKSGFEVVVMDCDMGKSNEKFYRDLGATPENPFFLHPASQEKVFCMFDAPHLLKLGRNHLLDKGYDLAPSGSGPSKQLATIDPLLELIKLTNVDIPAHRVTLSHLMVKGPERQSVREAAQVLSRRSSLALDKAGSLGEIKSAHYKVRNIPNF